MFTAFLEAVECQSSIDRSFSFPNTPYSVLPGTQLRKPRERELGGVKESYAFKGDLIQRSPPQVNRNIRRGAIGFFPHQDLFLFLIFTIRNQFDARIGKSPENLRGPYFDVRSLTSREAFLPKLYHPRDRQTFIALYYYYYYYYSGPCLVGLLAPRPDSLLVLHVPGF